MSPRIVEGEPLSAAVRIGVVVSRFNSSITESLLDGCLATLSEHGVADAGVDVVWVPGAWEIPLVAQRMAASLDYQAVICLGAVIRGATTHDQHINAQVSQSLGRIALRHEVPVLFGLLTCHSVEQALERSGGRLGNKGSQCAVAALEMANLMSKLSRQDDNL